MITRGHILGDAALSCSGYLEMAPCLSWLSPGCSTVGRVLLQHLLLPHLPVNQTFPYVFPLHASLLGLLSTTYLARNLNQGPLSYI